MNKLTLPQQIASMDADRLRLYRENLEFYNGWQWPGSGRRRERRLTFNYAKVFIDKVTSYLMSGLNFAVEPADDSAQAREQARRTEAAIYEVYEANNLEQLDFDTEIDAAILGDGCFKVTWDSAEQRVRVSTPGMSRGCSSGGWATMSVASGGWPAVTSSPLRRWSNFTAYAAAPVPPEAGAVWWRCGQTGTSNSG